LHLLIDGVDQGAVAHNLPSQCHAVVDLYGLCDAVTFVTDPTPSTAEDPPSDQSVQSTTPPNDCREKGDIEECMKEKKFKSPPTSPLIPAHRKLPPIPNCDTLLTAKRFIASLGLPSDFFRFDQSECFCSSCLKTRGESLSHTRRGGDPPKAFSIPTGWVCLALHYQQRVRVSTQQDKWHTAFHATTLHKLRPTLDSGCLEDDSDDLLTASSDVCWSLDPEGSEERKKEAQEETSKAQVLLSPSISLIQADPSTESVDFHDSKTGRRFRASVALQVLVKPGSYVTSGASNPASQATVDPGLPNNELEWRTKEQGGLTIGGLLVKLE